MNILLLGNGYDLKYKLPTSYHDFLITIDFLTKHSVESINTIGDVFGNKALNEQDKFIKESYETYKEVYDNVTVEKDAIILIVKLAKSNIWFSYFINSFNREAGWIDFEREIAYVVDCFQSFLNKAHEAFIPDFVFPVKSELYVIMKVFNFFIANQRNSKDILYQKTRWMRPEYTTEYPLNSGNRIVNKEKIIEVLSDQLKEFVFILDLYLKHFIEKSTESLIKQSNIYQLQALKYSDIVVTLDWYPENWTTIDRNLVVRNQTIEQKRESLINNSDRYEISQPKLAQIWYNIRD